MAVTAKSKISAMVRMRKADISVREEYTKIETEYEESKKDYKDYKDYKKDYEEKKEQLKEYNAILKETPWSERRDIKKKIKRLQTKISITEKKYKKAREEYKENLKQLRDLKRTIRRQYKNCKVFEKFFSKLDEAEKMGIDIPRYIKIEARQQKSLYQTATFSIDKKRGAYSYIPEPNMDCVRELASLIREKKVKDRQEKVQKVIENVKEAFSKPEGIEPGDM